MPNSHQVLSYNDANTAVNAIISALADIGTPVVIAVCDDHGELILLARTDGAPLPCIMNAANKAFTAARERKPSRSIGDATRDPQNGFGIGNYGDPRYTGWGGGLPVIEAGAALGAVAVSGLSEDDDVKLAQIGIDAINASRAKGSRDRQ
jgi:glc operon protein GlcG